MREIITINILQFHIINTLGPRQIGRHFPDDLFKWIFLNENVWISIKISLKFVLKGLINNIPALVQIMAWRRPGDKPLSEPMMICLLTHICVTRPQWVNKFGFLVGRPMSSMTGIWQTRLKGISSPFNKISSIPHLHVVFVLRPTAIYLMLTCASSWINSDLICHDVHVCESEITNSDSFIINNIGKKTRSNSNKGQKCSNIW